MEISINQSKVLQTVAILMMLVLHLFNRNYAGLFQPLLFVGTQPLSYYISLFCGICVPIFLFVSGYGLFFTFQKKEHIYNKSNLKRILRLYINYWIIVIVFAVLLGLFLNKDGYPGSLKKFMLNILALDNSYNGAWWFFFTYILLVFSSSIFFQLLNKYKYYWFLLVAINFYFVAFYFRVYQSHMFEQEFLNWLQEQICLFGTSFLPFLMGAIALKYSWNTKVSLFFTKIKFKNSVAFSGIILLIIIHAFIPNYVIDPFLALPFIFLFNQINFSKKITKSLLFLSMHSTNLWLIHMFFYKTYFREFIYRPKYVLFIFLLLVVTCVLCSYFINKIYKLILRKFNLTK